MRIALLITLLAATGLRQAENQPFSVVLDSHLKAIQVRDLVGLLATVHDSVTLIFPDGRALVSKSEFASFHKEWFADKKWKMEFTILKKTETQSISYALVRYKYWDTEHGDPRENFLMLIFKSENDRWLLLHDQNTKILN
jgi:ketosteroid isomerase-like protein